MKRRIRIIEEVGRTCHGGSAFVNSRGQASDMQMYHMVLSGAEGFSIRPTRLRVAPENDP